jgi:hypothetical protein
MIEIPGQHRHAGVQQGRFHPAVGQSILFQDYEDFELIISDNLHGRNEAICRELAGVETAYPTQPE